MYSYINYMEESKPVHTVIIPGNCNHGHGHSN